MFVGQQFRSSDFKLADANVSEKSFEKEQGAAGEMLDRLFLDRLYEPALRHVQPLPSHPPQTHLQS